MHRENWDDLRFVLAVAETGSVSAAARALGVNHATVLRRVSAFEDRHGIRLFNRTATGYEVPRDRARLIEAAREAEAAHLAVARIVAGARAPLAGAVRVTSTDTFCVAVLPAVLARLRVEAPDLRIDLLCSNEHADLARIEAEIAVRPAPRLPDELVGEAVAQLGFAPYAPADRPETTRWLGLSGSLTRSPAADWMRAQAAGQALAGAADSFVVLREMVAAGQGRAVIPCVLGDGDPRLVRLDTGGERVSVPVWVASHADLADAPRLSAVRRRLGAALRADAARLAGGAGLR
ncbi:MAG: LysR family transcriptional regulator [Rhodobacteraceae bacterium]|nr:LysR family transcriptional regulator [Paracoccaceae bacterium]